MTDVAAETAAAVRPRRAPGVIPWTEIRAAYEGSDVPLQLVATAYGIGVTDIYPRAEREGWMLRRERRIMERKARRTGAEGAPPADRSELIERLFAAAERQIDEIAARAAGRAGIPDDRDIRALGALARTIDLLIGLERDEAARRAAVDKHEGRGDIDQLRRDLARRIESLRNG
jgi:hypothetical protein